MTTQTKKIDRKIGMFAAPNMNPKHMEAGIDLIKILLYYYEKDLFQLEMYNDEYHGTIPSAKDIYDEILKDLHNSEIFDIETCKSLKERAERWKPVTEAYTRVCKCPDKYRGGECLFIGMDFILGEIIRTLGYALLAFDAMDKNKDIVNVLRYIHNEYKKYEK